MSKINRLKLHPKVLQKLVEIHNTKCFLFFCCRLSTEINVTEQHSPERSKFREGLTTVSDVEKVYLTGTYKAKYKMLGEHLAANSSFKLFPPPEMDGSLRKTRSAYPTVRIRPNTSTYRVYSQVGSQTLSMLPVVVLNVQMCIELFRLILYL